MKKKKRAICKERIQNNGKRGLILTVTRNNRLSQDTLFWCRFQRVCVLNVRVAVHIFVHFRGSHSSHKKKKKINMKTKALTDELGSWLEGI